MWMEQIGEKKFKYFERYEHPLTGKQRKVSVTLNSKSNQAKKEATIILQKKIDEIIIKKKDTNMNFQQAIDEYKVYYKKRVKTSSYISFKSMYQKLIDLIGKDTLIKNISTQYLKEKIEQMYYDETYSFNYVKRAKAIIISVLKLQQERGYNIVLPIFKLNLNLRQEKKPDKYLEKHELRALINQLNSYAKNTRKADMVEFLALTGLRYGELIALREEDLFEGYIKVTGTIDFRQGTYGDNIRTTPKTSAAFRNVILSNRAIEVLFKVLQENELYKITEKYEDEGYIFTNTKGKPIDYRTFEPTIKRAGVKAKINKTVTSHVLRHTHISFLAEFGLPLKTIMDRVGHKDSSTTLQIYTHVTSKMKNQLVDKLNTLDY